jgi:X-X-X-Leu-X-X-Gly heptad repeat protein
MIHPAAVVAPDAGAELVDGLGTVADGLGTVADWPALGAGAEPLPNTWNSHSEYPYWEVRAVPYIRT